MLDANPKARRPISPDDISGCGRDSKAAPILALQAALSPVAHSRSLARIYLITAFSCCIAPHGSHRDTAYIRVIASQGNSGRTLAWRTFRD
jgi:hypothetical protein